FELIKRSIQSDSDRDRCAGQLQILMGLALSYCQTATRRLQFKSKDRAIPDHQDVRDAGTDTKALQDRGFDGRPPTTVRNMERKRPRRAAHCQVLEHGALDRLLRAI